MIIGISGKIGSGKDTVGKIIQCLTHNDKPDKIVEIVTKNWLPINEDCNWQIKKFAEKLKQTVSLLTGISREDLEKQEVKDRILGEEWCFDKQFKPATVNEDTPMIEYTRKLPTVRWMLQTVGTEAMRNHVHENVWINALFADYKRSDLGKAKLKRKGMENAISAADFAGEYLPNWIITDLRFPNELKAVEDRFGITIRIKRDNQFSSEAPSFHPSETALDNAKFKYTIINNGTIENLIEAVKQILISEKIL